MGNRLFFDGDCGDGARFGAFLAATGSTTIGTRDDLGLAKFIESEYGIAQSDAGAAPDTKLLIDYSLHGSSFGIDDTFLFYWLTVGCQFTWATLSFARDRQ